MGFTDLLQKKEKSTKINELIFKEFVKRGYSLEGNTKIWNIADSKLWYLTPEQAQGFLELENSEDYQKEVIEKEINLIKENLDSILKKIGKSPLNIIDLGCGDGKKAVNLISQLKDKIKLRYCPVDISNYMVEKAIDNLKEHLKRQEDIIAFQWNISDFDNLENVTASLRQSCIIQGSCFNKNLLLLLGSTLGNFEINEFLYAISNSMEKGDYLLIGNGINNGNIEGILKSYQQEKINEWLIKMLIQIGLKREDLKYGTRFKNSRVEEYYTLLNDVQISFLDRKIHFNKGDQIIVAVSYQYNKDALAKFIKIYFRDIKIITSSDGSYAIILCKK